MPGNGDTDPDDVEAVVRHTRRSARRRRWRCCRARRRGRAGDRSARAAARAGRPGRGSRPSATCHRRRRRRRRGDRRPPPLQRRSPSRTTLNDSARGRSGSRPAWRASATARRWARIRSTIGSRSSSTNCAPVAPTSPCSPSGAVAEHPHDGTRTAHAHRAVAVLHRRVRLGPEAGCLPALQRRLLSDGRRPTAAEERDLADVPGGDGERAGHRPGGRLDDRSEVLAERGAQHRQDGRREACLDHRPLGGDIELDDIVRQRRDRRRTVGGDRHDRRRFVASGDPGKDVENLGGSPRSGDRRRPGRTADRRGTRWPQRHPSRPHRWPRATRSRPWRRTARYRTRRRRHAHPALATPPRALGRRRRPRPSTMAVTPARPRCAYLAWSCRSRVSPVV